VQAGVLRAGSLCLGPRDGGGRACGAPPPWGCGSLVARWAPQVLSACTVAFAHGANEVGNGIGPFNAAFYVYNNMKVRGH
jgi:hypothetical protein